MSGWGTKILSPATGIAYAYYPAVWEDSGKVYVKAQGALDVNIYDVATDAWSSITLQTDGYDGDNSGSYRRYESNATRQELIWVADGALYAFWPSCWYASGNQQPFLEKVSIADGSRTSVAFVAEFGRTDGGHGDWGRNRHKAVVKEPVSGRIFLINFYMKQIYEFIAATETFVLVKTWTETIGGQNSDDVAGCDAVALNGMIYVMGKHNPDVNGGGISGPLEINILTWATTTMAAYPDFGNQCAYTYNHYCHTQWLAIGNSIYGYGGQIRSNTNADGNSGSWDGSAWINCLRQIEFDPGTDTWSDLGTIPASLLHAGSATYNNRAFLIAGYDNGSASQLTREFTYLPDPATAITMTWDPVNSSIDVGWSYGTDPDSFKIRRKPQTTGATWTTLATVAGTARTYPDATADLVNYSYDYEITAMIVIT